MNTATINVQDFDIHIRVDRKMHDMDVVREVISADGYRLSKLAKIIPSPKVILDIGGHIGTFGLLAKRYWPDSQLIALEPNIVSFELYKINMQANDCTNYHLINKAIGYDKAATCLIEASDATGSGFLRTKKQAEEIIYNGVKGVLVERMLYRPWDLTIGSSNVQTITVEEILKQFAIKKVGLAKWDCEGGEIDAFKMMSNAAASCFEYMIGEYHIPNKIGELLSGNVHDYEEFCDLVKKRFSLSELITSKTCPLGHFWAIPKTAERIDLGSSVIRV